MKNAKKWLYISLVIILGLAAFLSVVILGPAVRHPLEPGKVVANVHYLDSVGSNFLFRGGLPQFGRPPVFNYQGLKRAIAAAGQKAGIGVPPDYYLIDVNFLNIENPSDAQWIFTEQKFFKDHPGLGRIQVWGMNGTGISAADPAIAGCRGYLARHLDAWMNDRLILRIETLRRWLESGDAQIGKTKKPVVIYLHCVAGCDRTGEFSGAYYLRFLHKSWEDVNALNRSMCHHNRPFGCKNYRALQWYCLWLDLERGFSLNWWKEFSCRGK